MAWWGKIIGGAFGYMLGGPLGAMLGAALGHNVDEGLARPFEGRRPGGPDARESVQTAFYTATFAVMGHICKADGRITDREINLARSVMGRMDLAPDQIRTAMHLFSEGKSHDFPLDAVLAQLRHEIRNRHSLKRMFLEIQLAAAWADAHLDPAEHRLLLYVSDRLGFSRLDYQRLEAMARAEAGHRWRSRAEAPREAREEYSVDDAFAILNVTVTATNDEVKKAYRRLMSQHHPDKLVAKGLPEEMIKLATQKTREIRAAYESIREARGF